jgi:O-antigen/teichoic acid export membrane protein
MTERSRTTVLPEGAEPGTIPGAGFEDLNASPIEGRLDLHGRTLRQHTARGTLINSGFQIGLAALGLLQKLAVAVFLTTSQYGLWGLLVATVISLAFLKQVGIGDKYVQQDEPDQELAFQKAFTLEAMTNGAMLLIVLAALPLFALVYGRPEIIAPGLVLCIAFLWTTLQTPVWIFYRQMRFVRQRTIEALDAVTGLVVTIALAAAGLGYWSLVVGTLAGGAASAIAAVASSPYPLAFRYERGTMREYVAFSWPLLVASATSIVIPQATMLAGEWKLGLAGAGAIALASSISMYTDRVDAIITQTLYPAICAVKDRTELLLESFVKSNRLALMWGFPFGVGLTLFAPDLVEFVLGDRWKPAVGLMQAFGLIAAFNHIGFNWSAYFRARGDTRPIAVVTVITVATFVAIPIPLLITSGLDGLAIGMGAATAVSLVVRTHFLTRLFPGFEMLVHMARAIAPTVPAVAVVLGFRLVSNVDRTWGVAVGELALYIAVTVLATVLLERALLREVFGYLRRSTAAQPA